MLQIIKRLFAGGEAIEPVLTPPGFSAPKLPAVDSDGGEAPAAVSAIDGDDASALANRAFVIAYVDSSGAESERRIICRQVYITGDKTYIQAVCLERQAIRSFRVDRITEVYCGVSGEDLGAANLIFVGGIARPQRAVPKTNPAVLSGRRALQVLITLARCDGQVHPSEVQVIEEFLDRSLPGRTTIKERAGLLDYAMRLAPSYGTFVRTFERMLEVDDNLIGPVLQAAIDVAEADGHWHPEEIETIKFLVDVAKEAGVDVNIDL
nr:TerB family tellurite resistance protein [uncultured Brevundimonas sp.]